MKYMATIEADKKPVSCEFIGCNGNAAPYLIGATTNIKTLDLQESVLDKVRNEIAEYGSIWVAYAITGHSDRDIENLIEGVLKQAKEQVLNIIDKYRTESEE